MPLYCYRCMDCGCWDRIVAGIDDDAASCIRCGGLMLRTSNNLLGPYFEEVPGLLANDFHCQETVDSQTSHMERRTAKELVYKRIG
jgi:predicted nucleic acid-binding Zn ribbon protein